MVDTKNMMSRQDAFDLITFRKNTVLLSFKKILDFRKSIRQCDIPEIFVANEAYESKYYLKGYVENRIL